MIFRYISTIISLFWISISIAVGITTNPVDISLDKVSWISESEVIIDIKVNISDGWKLSAIPEDGDSVSKPPEITHAGSVNVKSIKVFWPQPTLWQKDGEKGRAYFKSVSIPISVKSEKPGEMITLNLSFDMLACSDACMPIKHTMPMVLAPPVSKTVGKSASMIEILAAAFLGGLILNVMPCVLPVLGIKLKSISKANKDMFKKIFLFTALGIMISFWGFAIFAILLKYFFQQEMGWGTQFQNPYFVSAMIVGSSLFSLSLLGVFHFNVPQWVTKIVPKTDSSVAEAFFSGMFAVLLATPCCAPFMGSALGFALTRNAPEIIMVFTSIGAGFASPYILGAFLPISRIIPKPGVWSLYIEYAAGVMLFGSVIWLLHTLSALQAPVEKIASHFLLAFAILSIIAGNSQRLTKNSDTIKKLLTYALPIIFFSSFVSLPVCKDCFSGARHAKKKFDLGKIKWVPWSDKEMRKRLSEGKIVFVDVTASWCFSCQINKKAVLCDPAAQDLLASDDIVVMIADWTKKSPEIEKFLKQYERVGIPFNILISKWYPNGIILSEVLTKEEIIKAINIIRKFTKTNIATDAPK